MFSFSFLDAITTLPASQADAERGFHSLSAHMRSMENETLTEQVDAIIAHPKGKALLACVFTYSPFLTRHILNDIPFFIDLCIRGPEYCLGTVKAMMEEPSARSAAALMQTLRIAKGRASLLIACADLAGLWTLDHVTQAMSEVACLSVQHAVNFILREAHEKREIALPYPQIPYKNSGLIVLGMGKLGAKELNYSSDIDLIILFDKEAIHYTGAQSVERFFPRLAQELVRLLQERTKEGYAFRVDLRLRPDPASTPVALSTAGAITYYETVGQNWERAALIKARPIAGDMEAGYRFLRQIAPFIWRKHLDFAAIADIQSIKRQMDARSGQIIEISGHNVKTGLGGIREIEFFAQIHQLIWGGREASLRITGTCTTLRTLGQLTLIPSDLAKKLTKSYCFLRTVEHRLQMVDDQQTHSIPISTEAREKLAAFMGFSDSPTFERMLMEHLTFVHANFAASFRGQGALGGDEGHLSFTGVENDPETLQTLQKMGYGNASSVSEIIQGWHRGTRRATRTKRARELITELTPTLLKALASTADPDQAFIRFDEFLTRLPAGVQLFSLFHANLHLLELIAMIMGSAPALAESLSKHPTLLDTVLMADFYLELPKKEELFDELSAQLMLAHNFEDEMDIIRRFKNEKQFQAGIQLIRRQITASDVGHYLSNIADTCIEALLHRVEIAFNEKQACEKGKLIIVALGRLGAKELTFGSDIDLVFVYDADKHELYNKLSQRFITALTSLTREGRLYEVDTRLRPSGLDGLLAVSVGTFEKYLRESAWTFELMAFTRARAIAGMPSLRQTVETVIGQRLRQPNDAGKLVNDILDLRARITREHGSDNPWNLKYAHGGLMDIDFLAQYLILLHAPQHPLLTGQASDEVYIKTMGYKLIDPKTGKELLEAHRFLTSLFVLTRLCAVGILNEETAPLGLKELIAHGLGLADLDQVKTRLLDTLATVRRHFSAMLKTSHNT